MPSLAEVLRRHGPAYLERYAASLLPSHVRAVQAICDCRTPAMGGHLAQCDQCGREHLLYHSCRHRACPRCGYDATTRWLDRQRELLLPVPYFHVVFTLPSELRRLVRSHQRVLLSVLFQAAFESLAALCRDPRFIGGQIGALAVLHTWTRTLEWHPHVHMLVPGGGLAPDGRTWVRPPRHRKDFLVPVRALASRFRGRFLWLARRALPGVALPGVPPRKRWVVFAKPVVQGADRVLHYLGRYVQRAAIGGRAIAAVDDRTVTFRYKDSRNHQRKAMTLDAHEFLRRFLQHVPPKGFHRVRTFGLLHAAHRLTLHRLQLLLRPSPPSPPDDATPVLRSVSSRPCPYCASGRLRLRHRLRPAECLALSIRLAATARTPTARAPPPPPLGAAP